MELDTTELDVDDSDGDTLAPSSVITTAANTKLTTTILKSEGTFEFAIINNGDNKDDIESVVLAGTSDVTLAEFKMEADLEDIKVNSLKLRIGANPIGGTNVWAPAETINQANVVLVPAATETTILTVSTIPVFNGNIQVNVAGNTYTTAVTAGDSAITVGGLLETSIGAEATDNGDGTVTIVSANVNTNDVDATVNLGGTNAVVDIAIAQ
jgi:hypothetical protein